jgi:hypothetical protein
MQVITIISIQYFFVHFMPLNVIIYIYIYIMPPHIPFTIVGAKWNFQLLFNYFIYFLKIYFDSQHSLVVNVVHLPN